MILITRCPFIVAVYPCWYIHADMVAEIHLPWQAQPAIVGSKKDDCDEGVSVGRNPMCSILVD